MKRVLIFAIFLVALIYVFRFVVGYGLDLYHERSFTASSEARVNSVLSTLEEHGTAPTAEFLAAACMWYRGVPYIRESGELGRAEIGFIAWLQRGKIYNNVKSYAISGVEHDRGEDEPRVTVSCTINGRKARIKVTRNMPLEWLK